VGDGADDLAGGAGDDRLFGGAGDDLLRGQADDDTLSGGIGEDTLAGGPGRDLMRGDGGADAFAFIALADSRAGGADRIMDLENADGIDLSAIDADAGHAGDQAFERVARFSHHAGEMVVAYRADIGFTQVRLDVDGDARSDMIIAIRGDHTDFDNFVL
jgi:Ca2+-binding RTX toxin-like protein